MITASQKSSCPESKNGSQLNQLQRCLIELKLTFVLHFCFTVQMRVRANYCTQEINYLTGEALSVDKPNITTDMIEDSKFFLPLLHELITTNQFSFFSFFKYNISQLDSEYFSFCNIQLSSDFFGFGKSYNQTLAWVVLLIIFKILKSNFSSHYHQPDKNDWVTV